MRRLVWYLSGGTPKDFLERSTEMKRTLSNQVRDGELYALPKMLVDIGGRNSLLPCGEPALK